MIDFDYPDKSKVLGLSLSHYSGIVDFAVAKAGGVKFTIIKAANGLLTGTRYFKENYKGAKDNGILVGAYTWLYPASSYSPGTQARNFVFFLKDYPCDIRPCVDFEWTTPKNPNSSDLWGFVSPFRDNYGAVPMVYTAQGYWDEYGKNTALFAGCPLWQAHYTAATIKVIPPWTQWDFLQWTEKGKGVDYGVPITGERACELNYWRGTEQQLYEWCNVAQPTTPSVELPVVKVRSARKIVYDDGTEQVI